MEELDVSKIRKEFSRFCRYLRGKYKSKREGESIILSCVFEYPISIDVELAKRMTEETSWIDIRGRSWHPELPRTSSILIEGNLISLELPRSKCRGFFDTRSSMECTEVHVKELTIELMPKAGLVKVKARGE